MQLALAVLFLLAAVQLSCQRADKSSPTYVAAVVEYAPALGITMDNKDEFFRRNVEAYAQFARKAADAEADILVFPECGLVSLGLPRMPDGSPALAVEVPAPEERVNPCLDAARNLSQELRDLSCAARGNALYMVVNLPEREPCESHRSKCTGCPGFDPCAVPAGNCTSRQRLCPKGGSFFYNTNVAFDRDGTIIARYRKYNLFGELGFHSPPEAELSVFDTDFGVRFGMFICFDLMFEEPSVKLVQELGVRDIVFPTAWFSELPFLTAVQTQAAWSYAMDVNFLGAGYNYPEVGSAGSGIYAGKKGAVVATMPQVRGSSLLVAPLVKKSAQCYDALTTLVPKGCVLPIEPDIPPEPQTLLSIEDDARPPNAIKQQWLDRDDEIEDELLEDYVEVTRTVKHEITDETDLDNEIEQEEYRREMDDEHLAYRADDFESTDVEEPQLFVVEEPAQNVESQKPVSTSGSSPKEQEENHIPQQVSRNKEEYADFEVGTDELPETEYEHELTETVLEPKLEISAVRVKGEECGEFKEPETLNGVLECQEDVQLKPEDDQQPKLDSEAVHKEESEGCDEKTLGSEQGRDQVTLYDEAVSVVESEHYDEQDKEALALPQGDCVNGEVDREEQRSNLDMERDQKASESETDIEKQPSDHGRADELLSDAPEGQNIPEEPIGLQPEASQLGSRLYLKRENLENYVTFKLTSEKMLENSTVRLCHGIFCCDFKVVMYTGIDKPHFKKPDCVRSMTNQRADEENIEPHNPLLSSDGEAQRQESLEDTSEDEVANLQNEISRYYYRLAALDGLRNFDNLAQGGLQVCAIIPCANDTLDSCGRAIYDTEPNMNFTHFQSVEISGIFHLNHTIHTPNTLTDKILPLPVTNFDFQKEVISEDEVRVTMRTTTEDLTFLTFGILGRNFLMDDARIEDTYCEA